MTGQAETTETGKGYDAIVLPLVLLTGATGLAMFLAWMIFIVLYMLFFLGMFVLIASVSLSGGCY